MLSEKKILIVDYDNIRIGRIRQNLKSAKATCYVAINGQDALEQCKANVFNLIIINIESPGINGFNITKAIREQNDFLTNFNVSIIGFSQYTRSNTEKLALQSGMDAYLANIYDSFLLIQAIKELKNFHPISNVSFATSLESSFDSSFSSNENSPVITPNSTHYKPQKKRCVIL